MMNRRLLSLAGAAALALTANCGGDSAGTTGPKPTPTPTPTPSYSGPYTLTILTSATQTSPANVAPSEGVGVKVTDSLGAPVKGIDLTWTPTAGGSVHVTGSTDSLGRSIALWTLGPSAAPQTLTVSHAKAKTPAVFTGYVPIGSVTANATASTGHIGDTLSSYMTIKDIKGTVLTGPARVVVRDTTIVKDPLGTGTLVGAGDGSSYVVVVSGPLNSPADSVKLDVYRTLRGSVYTFDDSPLPALRAYSTNGGVTDSADVGASGKYVLPLTAHGAGWTTEVLIDAVNTTARAFFPALMPVANHCTVRDLPNCIGSDANADISFVLVPTSYTVKRGKYTGQTLAVNLEDAMVTSTHSGPAYLDVSGAYQAAITAAGTAPQLQNLYTAPDQFWLPDSFPIGVALHRACCSTRQVVADDSIQLWRALDAVQTTLGYQIWTPINDQAGFKTDRSSSTTPNRVLVFQFDSTFPPSIAAGASTGPIAATVSSANTLMLQDFVITGWRHSATDHLTISSSVSAAQLVGYNPTLAGSMAHDILVHEVMHTLGVGHGCAWTSTQSYCGAETPDTLPSFQDAAYLLLAMDVKSALFKHHALHGLTAALFGQRAIMLKLDPVPAPWTLPDPGTSGGFDRATRLPRMPRP